MQQTEHSQDYQIAFHVGVRQARELQQPDLNGDVLLYLALVAYDSSSRVLKLNKQEFLLGWGTGWNGYYNGIIAESEVVS